MKRILSLILVSAFMVGCTSEENRRLAKQTLEDQGYTQIKFTGYEWSGCGEEDDYADGFTAVSSKGRKVGGVACAGTFKGTTIRWK